MMGATGGAGLPALGTMLLSLNCPSVVRLLKASGLHFVIIDCEHASFSLRDVEGIATAAALCGLDCMVRVAGITSELIGKPLDLGASAVIVPRIRSVEEARQAVMLSKFPPLGSRGLSLRRPHMGYRRVNTDTYLHEANEASHLWLQVETVSALDDLARILETEGIHGAFVGPVDLQFDLQLHGRDKGSWSDVLAQVIKSCRNTGVVPGIHAASLEEASTALAMGFAMVSFGSDITHIGDTLERFVREADSTIGGASQHE